MRQSIRRILVLGAVCTAAVLAMATEARGQTPAPMYAPYLNRNSIELRGYFRDFVPAYRGGHPDFGVRATGGTGRYADMAGNYLDVDGKPVLITTGHRVLAQRTDAAGMPIIWPKPYILSRAGDTAGSRASTQGGAASSAAGFAQWFRTVPGVNTAAEGTVTLTRVPGTSNFVFDGRVDGGGPLLSTLESPSNNAYTYEMRTTFVQETGRNWFLRVATEGEIWGFIDGRLVLDSGSGRSLIGVEGIVADGPVRLSNTSRILVDPDVAGSVSTNLNTPGALSVNHTAHLNADVFVGPGADVNTAITGAGTISGQRGTLQTAIPMPAIAVPDNLPNLGNVIYKRQNTTIAASMRVSSLTIEVQSSITIAGSVIIVCDGPFILRNASQIILAPGATLDLYIGGGGFMGQTVQFNSNTADPARVTIINYGLVSMITDNTAQIHANIVSPQAELVVGNLVSIWGNFIGRAFTMNNDASFTITGSSGWGARISGGGTPMSQLIQLDRLNWLQHGRTYELKLFFADRDCRPSRLRIDTNIQTLNLANIPVAVAGD